MKGARRAVAIVATALVGAAAGYAALLAHPEPLFAHVAVYGQLAFYSQAPLPAEASELASRVARRLATSPLFDEQLAQRVFVVGRPWLWNLLNGPLRRAMARNVELGNAILVPTLDVERRLVCHFDGRCAGAVGILTHECVHTLVQRRIGLLRLWRLAWWQKEGYPEYVASEGGTRSEAPERYRETALAWKGLLERRHLTIDEILRLPPTEVPPSQ